MRSKGIIASFFLLVLFFLLQIGICFSQTSNLIAHWTFDDGSGSYALDYSGNDLTATLINGPSWTQGKLNGALRFDGEDDYATTDFYPGATPYTAMAWFKFDNFTSYEACGTNDGANHRLYFGIYNNSCYWGLGTTYHRDYATHGMSTGTWYHITMVGDGYTGKYYINAIEKDTMTYSWSGTSSTPFLIGAFTNNLERNIDGIIDDMRIYNIALSQEEILAIYNGGDPEPDTEDPSTPTNLSASAVSHTRIDLSWNASTDNVGVLGYRIYRNGVEINTSPYTTYTDIGLAPSTLYTYQVSAYDSAGNESQKSSSASATTHEQPSTVYYTLTISAPNGSVTKNPNPDPEGFLEGTTVELTAIPNTGYVFSTWGGDVTGSVNPVSIVMDSDKSVTAYFAQQGSNPIARIHIEPSTTVEVGEEIYFDAQSTSDDKSLDTGKFEWEFGDHYTLKNDYPYYYYADSGISCTHHYMNPGTYTVTLTVTDTDGNKDTATASITVTGEDPKLPPMPSSDPILELKCDNENLLDTSPNNLNGQWINGTGAYQRGKEQQALFLEGGTGNPYVAVSHNGQLSGMNELTVSLWARKDTVSSYGYLVSFLEDNAPFSFRISESYIETWVRTNNGNVRAVQYGFYDADNTIWHHYAFTYDGSYIRIYIDGRELNATGKVPMPQTGTIKPSTNNLLVGIGNDGKAFRGTIDEVKIYNTALTLEELFTGFELWHANFQCHIEQYGYVQIPGRVTRDSTNKLKVFLTGKKSDNQDYQQELVLRDHLQSEERFLLKNIEIPAGDYHLVGQLLDSNNTVLDEVKQKLTKPYSGMPHIGINKNNAMCIDGEPFFPITPMMLNASLMKYWSAGGYINTLYAVGYYTENNLTTWADYLNDAQSYGLYTIGPVKWDGKDVPHFERNANVHKLADYVNTTKNYPSLMSWMWDNEPNMGGESEYIPAQVVRSWTYKCHRLDPYHIVTLDYYGFDYLHLDGWHKERVDKYDYLHNKEQFGGKRTFLLDQIAFDIYAFEYEVGMGRWALAMDRMKEWNYDLVPTRISVQTQDLRDGEGPGPSPDQLRMSSWIVLAHGIKSIRWFHYFKPTPSENYGVMAEIARHVKDLTPVLLGPDSEVFSVTDNANTWGNRVDTMLKEDSENIWIFTVRVTELDYATEELDDAEIGNRTVTFSLNAIPDGTPIYEPGEFTGSNYEQHGNPSSQSSQFSFTVSEPVTPGTLILSGQYGSDVSDRRFLYDNGSGVLYGYSSGMDGTINYATGAVSADFGRDIRTGQDKVKAMYQPVREDRIVGNLTNHSFTDTFAPNAVHIYRIPKDLSSDSEPPTVPDGLAAIPVSNSRIDLSWNASSDNMGVAGYKIFRDGHQIDTSFSTVYIDKGLAPLTTYTYRVSAYDGAGNESALSDPAVATTTDQSGETKKEYDFEDDQEDWTWWSTDNYTFNEVIGTHEPMPGTDDWALAMESDDTIAQTGSFPMLAYGFWQSPRTTAEDRISYSVGNLYLVRWSLVSNQSNVAEQPGLRFRISTGSDSCGGDIVLQEFNDTKIEITTDVDNPTIINHYWYPPQWLVNRNIALYPEQTGLYLAADMYDNRKSATGKYWIPRVEVLALAPPDKVTPVFSAPPFDISSNIWRDTTQNGYVDSWIDSEDGLSIRFPQNGDNLRHCYWEFIDPSAPIQLGANTLYRVTFTITSSGSKPPVFRERLIVRNLYLGSETVITPTIPQGYVFDFAIPGSTPREVICYLGIDDQYLVGDDLLFSMDVYSTAEGTDPYDGTYNVTDIEVEQLNIP